MKIPFHPMYNKLAGYLKHRGWIDKDIIDIINSGIWSMNILAEEQYTTIEINGRDVEDIEKEKAAIDEDFRMRITIAKLTDGEIS